MSPEWFREAHAAQGCEDLWQTCLYETWFSHERPWHPDLQCFGNFHPQFDEQPGISRARLGATVWGEERARIWKHLANRGIDIFELGELMVYQANQAWVSLTRNPEYGET